MANAQKAHPSPATEIRLELRGLTRRPRTGARAPGRRGVASEKSQRLMLLKQERGGRERLSQRELVKVRAWEID